jgi:hypothetical protein
MINVINGWNRLAVGFGLWSIRRLPRPRPRQPCDGGGRRLSEAAASFEPLRHKLIRVAYRMLGSVADAEDVVQEAFIRWMNAERAEVRVPEAFLRRMVMRMCPTS